MERPSQSAERLHALDALRAVAMLLGIVLHAAVCYMQHAPAYWAVHDPAPHAGFGIAVSLIHVFRMPVFFVMAGFFGALMLSRRGASAFVGRRATRIALPLLVGWVTFVPLTRAAFYFGYLVQGRAELSTGSAASLFRLTETWAHLWFLVFLLVYYAAALAVVALYRRVVPSHLRGRLRARVVMLLRSRGLPLLVAVAAAPCMFFMNGLFVDEVLAFTPPAHMLAYYGVFFATGWLLFDVHDALPVMFRRWPWLVAAGLLCLVPMLFSAREGAWLASVLPEASMDAIRRLCSAVSTSLLTFGVIGLFLHHFARPSAAARYIADASYWLYLAHLPLVVVGNALLAPLPWPPVVKFALVLAASTGLLLASYDLFVRYTFIGRVLNGPRTRLVRSDPALVRD